MPNPLLLDRLRERLILVDPSLPADIPAGSKFTEWELDSLDLVEFVARLEQDFGLMIADEDLPQLISLEATATYLEARLS